MRTTLLPILSITLVLGACGGPQHAEVPSAEASDTDAIAPIQHTEPAPIGHPEPTAENPPVHGDFPPPLPPPDFATDGAPVDAADFVLFGTWGMDTVAMIDHALNDMPDDIPEEIRMEMEMQRSIAERMHMSFEFREDGEVEVTVSMMEETQSEGGVYEVTSRQGESISITMAPADETQDTETIVFTIADSNTLVSLDEDGMVLILRRLQ
ncbi:MAG: hypothetical protein EA398_08655 [Deltaproteobacteria bacterium]|nr:MAG: hypothetical protein EA398_08655 [Deltaproteobacteria bacterium]